MTFIADDIYKLFIGITLEIYRKQNKYTYRKKLSCITVGQSFFSLLWGEWPKLFRASISSYFIAQRNLSTAWILYSIIVKSICEIDHHNQDSVFSDLRAGVFQKGISSQHFYSSKKICFFISFICLWRNVTFPCKKAFIGQ